MRKRIKISNAIDRDSIYIIISIRDDKISRFGWRWFYNIPIISNNDEKYKMNKSIYIL
jgi:hypothetical protein